MTCAALPRRVTRDNLSVSANPTTFRPTEFAAEHDLFVTGAAAALRATLFGARTRAATGWLAGFGLLTFAPLAMTSRNGWAFAGLMLFVIACIARWVAGLMFEREPAQAQPLVMLGLHAVIGAGWSAAGLATMADAYGHGPALVLVATVLVAAACVPMFERHRDACWWLLAPLAAVPMAVAFTSQPWAWPLAATGLVGLAAAAWHAQLSQAVALAQIEAGLRLKFVQAEWKKEQQAAIAATARLESRERDLNVLFEHAAVGIARVNGYVIEGVNDHLARLLGKPADHWVRHDVLSLFTKEYHAALDTIVKRQGGTQTATQAGPAPRERVGLAAHDGSVRLVDIVVPRADRAGLWLVFDPVDAAAPTTPHAEGNNAVRTGLLDRAGLKRRLQVHADERQRITVVTVALTGLDAMVHAHGEDAMQRVRAAIALRLEAVCRTDDGVAMLDDACYAVVMAGDPSDLTLSLMCDRVHSAMATPHTLARVGAPGRSEAPTPEQRGGSLTSVQFGVSVESLRCELDVNKASTALAQIDEFAALARAARRRVAAEHATASGETTTSNAHAHAHAHAHAPTIVNKPDTSRAPAAAVVVNDRSAPSLLALPSLLSVPDLREDAEVVMRQARRAAPAANVEPLVIDRIHIDPGPDDA